MSYNIEDTFLSNALLKRGNIPFSTPTDSNPSQVALDLISQGAPLELVISQTGLTADQISQLTQRPVAPEQSPQGVGLSSLLGEQSTEIENLVDQGLNLTQVANEAVKNVGGPELNLTDQKLELDIAEKLTKLGVDTDTVALDEADDLLTKLTAASLGGSAGDAEDDEESNKTLNATLQISDTLDPEDQLEVYKEAAKLFYNTDDIKKLVPEPDKTLPFLVAGASLIQSGDKDESWGTALSKAFLGYAGQTAKEKKAYEKTISGIDIKERQNVQNFAANMYIADRKAQKDLEKALLTGKKTPYKIEGQDKPVFMNTAELTVATNAGYTVLPYSEADGKVGQYTVYQDKNKDGIIDLNAPGKVQLMTAIEAKDLGESGSLVREGNLLKDKDFYVVDGVPGTYNKEELAAVVAENKNVSVQKVGAANVKAAINRTTGETEFVPNSILLTAAGREKYAPTTQGEVIFDRDGNPILVKGDASNALGTSYRNKTVADATKLFRENDTKVGNVLRGHFKIKSILDDAIQDGKPVLFGTTGAAGLLVKRLDDEIDSLNSVFSASKSDYVFFNDKNNNGVKDVGEIVPFEEFKNKFSIGEDSGIFQYLSGQGLDKKRIDNLVFTLALNSAALNNQKGRDISDKDMERNLRRAGAFATSEEEFRLLLDDLALEAIQHGQNIVDSAFRYDARMPDGKGGFSSPIFDAFPNVQKEYGTKPAFSGAPYSIDELRERVETSTGFNPNKTVTQNKDMDQDPARVISEVGKKQSGYGTATIDEIARRFNNLFNKDQRRGLGYLSKIRKDLGADSPEYKELQEYIKDGN